MSNSTNIIGDLKTVSGVAPTAASVAAAIAAAGPITDIAGLATVALAEAEGLKIKLTAIKNASDSGDANYFTTLNNIIGTLGS